MPNLNDDPYLQDCVANVSGLAHGVGAAAGGVAAGATIGAGMVEFAGGLAQPELAPALFPGAVTTGLASAQVYEITEPVAEQRTEHIFDDACAGAAYLHNEVPLLEEEAHHILHDLIDPPTPVAVSPDLASSAPASEPASLPFSSLFDFGSSGSGTSQHETTSTAFADISSPSPSHDSSSSSGGHDGSGGGGSSSSGSGGGDAR